MSDTLDRLLTELEENPWYAAPVEVRALFAVARAAADLHAEVEMAESVGTCLPSRVPSLRLGAALAALDGLAGEPQSEGGSVD